MKPLRNLTALLAVIALMLTLWAPMAVTADPVTQQEELFYFGRSIIAKMENSEALCYVYDKMVDACEHIEKSVDISHRTYRVTADEVVAIRELVLYDHPEFFWLQHVGMSSSGNGISTIIFYPDENTANYRNAVAARVKELTVGLEGKSDYEKSLLLHDRVANAVDYQFSANDQTVIGSLLEGASVCAGYAHAYQLLLQAVGIPSFYVAGHSKGQGHAWNMVQLDGDWYYTDVTWDDQTDHSPAEGGGVYYTYFNNTFDQMANTHTAEDFVEYLPKSTATKHNFYVKNGLVIDSDKPLDIAKLAKGLPAAYPPQFYVLGDVTTGVQAVFDNLYPIAQTIAGKSAYPNCTSAGMLDRGVILYMEIIHDHNYVTTDTVAPTCNNEGFASSRCTICGHVTEKTIDALGHAMEWQSDETHHQRTCTLCGLEESHGEHKMENNTCVDCGYAVEDQANYGDLNGDDAINNRDLALMQQHINKWAVEIDIEAADVNRDGAINNRDLALLQQYINKWDVTLG